MYDVRIRELKVTSQKDMTDRTEALWLSDQMNRFLYFMYIEFLVKKKKTFLHIIFHSRKVKLNSE